MNLKLVTMFKVMPRVDAAEALPFEQVNAEAAKYGWIIHPDCCSTLALKWINNEARTNYNATFYEKWSDITTKTRLDLLLDQLRHYASTYGTDFADGNGYVPNDSQDIEIQYKEFKVIMPATFEEIYGRCMSLVQSGIALAPTTLDPVIEFIKQHFDAFGLDIDSVKNKEAAARLMDIPEIFKNVTDPFMILRYLVYKATGNTLLIKNKATIEQIRYWQKCEYGLDLPTLISPEQRVALSTIFYRFKPLFLAFKVQSDHMKSLKNNSAWSKAIKKLKLELPPNGNARVINEIRRLAKKNHKPFYAGFWETVLSETKPLEEITSRLAKGEITNFKKFTLMQTVLENLQNRKGKVYTIRNGKMWIKTDVDPVSRDRYTYLMSVYAALESSVVESIRAKACTVRYPANVSISVPTSEKNFIGDYPFGTSVNMGSSHNIVGIYWRNEWGTHDFDLHMADLGGKCYGWNARYNDTAGDVIFSGDMTNADPEATELFYIKDSVRDCKISVSQYNGQPKSQFKMFVAREDRSTMKNGFQRYSSPNTPMCDPNNVVAEFMIPVDNEKDKQVAIVADNKLYLMDLSQGNNIVPRQEFAPVVIDQLKGKCRASITIREILEKAGFTEVTDPDAEVGLDLTRLTKDTLIGLFS